MFVLFACWPSLRERRTPTHAQAWREGELLAEVGDGGLFSTDFELVQQLGQLSVQVVAEPDRPEGSEASFTGRAEPASQTAVLAYKALWYSGQPYQDPVYTLVKVNLLAE